MRELMQGLAWLLLELQVPSVPDWLIRDPHFLHAVKEVLVYHECERADLLRYPHWGLDWNASLTRYNCGKTLPPLSYLEGFGFNSFDAVQDLGRRLEWAREARRGLAERVSLQPLGLRAGHAGLLEEFDWQLSVWTDLHWAAVSHHAYGDPLGARHKLKDLQDRVGDALRDRNLGPMIPDGYWRVLR